MDSEGLSVGSTKWQGGYVSVAVKRRVVSALIQANRAIVNSRRLAVAMREEPQQVGLVLSWLSSIGLASTEGKRRRWRVDLSGVAALLANMEAHNNEESAWTMSTSISS